MKRLASPIFASGTDRPTPLIVLGALLLASLTARCSAKTGSDESGDSGGSGAAAGTATSGQGGVIAQGGQGGVISPPTGGTQGVQCSVATDCQLPASVCDVDRVTLRYFTAPQCVVGQCTWMSQTMRCPSACYGGACMSSSTTTSISPPPPDPACLMEMGGASGVGGAGDAAAGTPSAGGISGGPGTAGNGGVATSGGSNGTAGAGAASGCPLPASYCQDSGTLVYFTEPHCVNLQCTANSNTLSCGGECFNGGCQGLGTATPAP